MARRERTGGRPPAESVRSAGSWARPGPHTAASGGGRRRSRQRPGKGPARAHAALLMTQVRGEQLHDALPGVLGRLLLVRLALAAEKAVAGLGVDHDFERLRLIAQRSLDF